ncbi:MAG TPA: helix-turn-helix transcriptional regulator, partial [Ktedonobacteraceae bacterium]|nr:helix-turn-helix transcriptional regulator [Ktedonobacteraceae bacterium]
MKFSNGLAIRRMMFGERLAKARTDSKLSQEQLAEAVGTTARSIRRWERNTTIPQLYYLERLCQVLQTTPDVLFGSSTEELQETVSPPSFWHVPYTRNPYFTGRAYHLYQLHARYHIASPRAQIVTGPGVIGKTQVAIEYIFRFSHQYQSVFWINGGTLEELTSNYLALADLLQLSCESTSNRAFVREAVIRWFQTHDDWLLVFDNVKDLEMLQTMLPDPRSGHVLITTPSQIIGTLGVHMNLDAMDQAEGALFLLRRAKLLSLDDPLNAAPVSLQGKAEAIVNLLEGFPLALDQAGAYIEETGCSLAEYLERYNERRQVLLNQRGVISNHHPESVALTFSLAFQR